MNGLTNLPIFHIFCRCRTFLHGVQNLRDRIKRPPGQNLEDFSTFFESEITEELKPKACAYQLLSEAGQVLIEMTTEKEKKELTRVCDDLAANWAQLLELKDQRKGKVDHLLQVSGIYGVFGKLYERVIHVFSLVVDNRS